MLARIFIHGFVQGVGYRQFVKSNAERLGLTGFIRNLPDGSVEAVFCGEKKTIEQMLDHCKKGPFLSEVENVQVTWENGKEDFTDFTIR